MVRLYYGFLVKNFIATLFVVTQSFMVWCGLFFAVVRHYTANCWPGVGTTAFSVSVLNIREVGFPLQWLPSSHNINIVEVEILFRCYVI